MPSDPETGILNELERGKLYDFHMRGDQIFNIVDGKTGDWHFNAGANFIKWPRRATIGLKKSRRALGKGPTATVR